jgi:hypothetical protein
MRQHVRATAELSDQIKRRGTTMHDRRTLCTTSSLAASGLAGWPGRLAATVLGFV